MEPLHLTPHNATKLQRGRWDYSVRTVALLETSKTNDRRLWAEAILLRGSSATTNSAAQFQTLGVHHYMRNSLSAH